MLSIKYTTQNVHVSRKQNILKKYISKSSTSRYHVDYSTAFLDISICESHSAARVRLHDDSILQIT